MPVMKELEAMGVNPIEHFLPDASVEHLERKYVAITRAKEKYPEWYSVVAGFIGSMEFANG